MTIVTAIAISTVILLLSMMTNCVASVSARRYHQDEMCWGPREVVAHDFGWAGCDGEQVIARGPDGDVWSFPDSCVPEEYERIEDGDLLAEIGNLPHCETR